MLLQIESLKPTAKSLVLKAGGKEYFAKKDSGITAGMTIEAETESSEYNGKTYIWVKKWTPAQQADTTPSRAGTANTSNVTPWWMPFVSNVCAHAIAAGVIQAPNQIEAWAIAARNAAQKIDSDIPY